jgi:peptidoglycan/LPS O-acetylase OafA/YrhL
MQLQEEIYIPKKQYGGLDFLRSIAICWVFIFHYQGGDFYEWFYKVKDFGWTGVDLFFVLSGFLIAQQLFKEANSSNTISLTKFYIKRFLRILPAYFFILFLYFSIPVFREKPVLSPLWKYLTFTQNIGLNPSETNAFTHAWSLCIEEQFYIVFPFIVLLLSFFKAQKKIFYIIAVLFLFTCLIRMYLWNNNLDPIKYPDASQGNFWITWMYYPTYSRLDGLLSGITVAAIFEYLPNLRDKLLKFGNLFFVFGCAILVGAYFLCIDRRSYNANVFGFPAISIGYGFCVIAALCQNSFLYKINFSFFKATAILSYAVYLCHKAICHYCHVYFTKHGVNDEGNIMLLICIVATLIAALIIRYLVEKPFLKLRDHFLLKQQNNI